MPMRKTHRVMLQLTLAALALFLLNFKPGLVNSLTAADWPRLAGTLEAVVDIFAWFSLGWLAIGLVQIFFWRLAEKVSGHPAPKLLQDIVTSLIIFSMLVGIFGFVFNAPISGLVAGSSVVAAVVGLAITRMISDVFSGMALNLEKSFSLGDWLEIEMKTRPAGAMTGRVIEINWRATRLLTQANEVIVIPNSEMARSKFVNYSLPEHHYRTEVQVPLSHAIPRERVKRILLAALKSTPGLMASPEPIVAAGKFDPRGVLWTVRFWVSDFALNRQALEAAHEHILHHLQVAGINISYNRVEQRFIKSDASELNKKPVKEALLTRLDLFEFLAPGDLDTLAGHMQELWFAPRTAIVRQGDDGASLFIVAEGLVSILVRGDNGHEHWVAHIEPGRYFGEMSLLTGQPRAASAQAETEVVCYEITKDILAPIFQRQPDLLERISRIMANRQVQLNRIQEEADVATGQAGTEGTGHWLLQQMHRFFGIKF